MHTGVTYHLIGWTAAHDGMLVMVVCNYGYTCSNSHEVWPANNNRQRWVHVMLGGLTHYLRWLGWAGRLLGMIGLLLLINIFLVWYGIVAVEVPATAKMHFSLMLLICAHSLVLEFGNYTFSGFMENPFGMQCQLVWPTCKWWHALLGVHSASDINFLNGRQRNRMRVIGDRIWPLKWLEQV